MRFSPDQAAVFTAASNNYLHFVRTLAQSARACLPAADLHCVVVDVDPEPARALAREFSAIALDDLRLPGGDGFRFQYSIVELNTAVKPWAFEHLLAQGYRKVIYLDPDVRVYRPLDDVLRLLDEGADIVLTPHLLAPLPADGCRPDELDIRRAGTYNLGFCALRDSASARAFLGWWREKLAAQCVIDQDRGLFVDQSWIDLAPGLFPNVAILRHPGCNVAYWNIGQRPIARAADGGWSAAGAPLAFFHYSGFDPFDPDALSRLQNRYRLADLGAVRELAREYASRLIENGAREFAALPYGFGSYADGAPIPEIARRTYRESARLRAAAGADPFAARAIVERYPAQQRRSGGAGSVGEARALALHWTLLGRTPEAGVSPRMIARCETLPGFVAAWFSMGLSLPSRSRPDLLQRLMRALLLA
jgi:hypothetical protein